MGKGKESRVRRTRIPEARELLYYIVWWPYWEDIWAKPWSKWEGWSCRYLQKSIHGRKNSWWVFIVEGERRRAVGNEVTIALHLSSLRFRVFFPPGLLNKYFFPLICWKYWDKVCMYFFCTTSVLKIHTKCEPDGACWVNKYIYKCPCFNSLNRVLHVDKMFSVCLACKLCDVSDHW